MTALEKIRAALDGAKRAAKLLMLAGLDKQSDEALAALAELERPAIAAAPKFEAVEVDDAMAARICNDALNNTDGVNAWAIGRAMIAAVRAELGPTLGLVELREPTPEECERICFAEMKIKPTQSWPAICGRAMFDAVRAVMWPKGGES